MMDLHFKKKTRSSEIWGLMLCDETLNAVNTHYEAGIKKGLSRGYFMYIGQGGVVVQKYPKSWNIGNKLISVKAHQNI